MESRRIHACYVLHRSHSSLESTFWSEAPLRYLKLNPLYKVHPVKCREGTEGCRGMALPLASVLDGGGWQSYRSAGRFTPGKETRYRLYRGPVWTYRSVICQLWSVTLPSFRLGASHSDCGLAYIQKERPVLATSHAG